MLKKILLISLLVTNGVFAREHTNVTVRCFESLGAIDISLDLEADKFQGEAAFKSLDLASYNSIKDYGVRSFTYTREMISIGGQLKEVLRFFGPKMDLIISLDAIEGFTPPLYNASISVDIPNIYDPTKDLSNEGILCGIY